MINHFSAFVLFCFRTLLELATGPGHVCNFVALSNEIRGIPHGGKKAIYIYQDSRMIAKNQWIDTENAAAHALT